MGKNHCSICGQATAGFASAVFVSPAQPSEPHVVCGRCAAEQHAETLHSLEEADHFIAEATKQLAVLEAHISKFPKMPEVPEGLEALAMTPISVYRTLQFHLAAFKSRRMVLITEDGSDARIQFEIQRAIEEENFELAAKLQKQLAERNEGNSPASA